MSITESTGTTTTPHRATVLVRYFASARAAVGTEQELVPTTTPATVADVLAELGSRHPDGLPRILTAASFLVDGIAVRDPATLVPDGAELDVLPPFAGG